MGRLRPRRGVGKNLPTLKALATFGAGLLPLLVAHLMGWLHGSGLSWVNVSATAAFVYVSVSVVVPRSFVILVRRGPGAVTALGDYERAAACIVSLSVVCMGTAIGCAITGAEVSGTAHEVAYVAANAWPFQVVILACTVVYFYLSEPLQA